MRKISDWLLIAFAWLSGIGTLLAVIALMFFLVKRGLGSLSMELFFGETPWLDAVSNKRPVFDGIWPAIVGTFLLVFLSSLMSIPIGIASGVYLAEYASERMRTFFGFAVDILAGIPSIVMGLFGFSLILLLRSTFLPQARTCLFLSSVCIALLILPYSIRTTQTALCAIPEHLRLLGPSLGFSQGQNIRQVLLPLAGRGILSGGILAVGRAAEDTAVILLTGVVAHAGIPRNLWDKYEALPFRIYYLAAEHRNVGELNQGFGTALVLLFLTGALFFLAFLIHKGMEKRWKAR